MTERIFLTLFKEMEQLYPNYASLWLSSKEEFGESWVLEFEDSILRLFGKDESKWIDAINGYAEFCTDALRSQIFFERKGHYKASSYDEVAAQYYHNKEFMYRSYLPGMFISHYIWPHHHRMLRYFRATLGLQKDILTIAEVGTGCGMYSKEALALFPEATACGYDISEHSLTFTSQVVSVFGFGDRYRTEICDIVTNTPPVSDLLICQEVLEHIQDPPSFLESLFKMTRRGGCAYITAAVNAGHVDHIYLYRSPEEVQMQIEDAGFEILSSKSEYGYSGKPIEVTPCHAAFLCRRRI